MSEGSAATRYEVKAIRGIDGPVGMDVGMWLRFDTEQGEVRLKLSHEDALELKQALEREHSIGVEPRKLVMTTADALLHLAGELSREEASAAARLKTHADELRLAADNMPADE